jgi:hypothetical protein
MDIKLHLNEWGIAAVAINEHGHISFSFQGRAGLNSEKGEEGTRTLFLKFPLH